jgi:putative phage head-tail adaptor|nr:MAG TPA: putative head tail adaptor [Caudoviricetes sp.]
MLNMDGVGRLTKRIEILGYRDIETDGITKQQLVPVIPNRVWARIEPLRGRQYLEMYKEKVDELYKITIRYRKGITDGVLIRYKDVVYKVKTVLDPYEEHTKLELMCHIYKRGK